MCDTFLFFNDSSCETGGFFAKNSDREFSELQIPIFSEGYDGNPNRDLIFEENRKYSSGAGRVTADYLFRKSGTGKKHAVFLSKPLWMWGAEIGVNDKGLAIGNEAVFSKNNSLSEGDGLLGMDVLRAALECCETAEEALSFIIKATEEVGLSADGGYKNIYRYDNSFLIMDGLRAFVFESAGKKWASKEIKKNWFISNAYSLRDDYDFSNIDGERVDFKAEYEDRAITLEKAGDYRRVQGLEYLKNKRLDTGTVKAALRSHLNDSGEINPGCRAICRHPDIANGICTTASIYVRYTEDGFTVWTTHSPFPCLSVYVPYRFGISEEINSWFTDPEKLAEKNRSYLNIFEILEEDPELSVEYRRERSILEKSFENDLESVHLSENSIEKVIINCYREENDFVQKWLNRGKQSNEV